jgi:hypothetical protein
VGWIIGIDEAGYGPNLGPFVMTAVACRVADAGAEIDLWDRLRSSVRRAGEADDGRLLVADSKVVYSTARGLLGLERGTLSTLWHPVGDCLAALIERACREEQADLKAEFWYGGTHTLPVAASAEELAATAKEFGRACAGADVAGWQAHSAIVCAPRFNSLVDAAGTKGAVLGHAITQLLRHLHNNLPGKDGLAFVVDKHGGRNTYAALLQHALGGAVIVRREGMACSDYEVLGLGREVRLSFRPRAEAECFCVALASMASKYLRELLMREFNRFWQQHVPDVKPTAGYPGDAARFLEAIRPALERLGIPEAAVWRRK